MDGPVLDALHALVGRAEAAGRARTMGELAAFHLRQPGVLEGLGVSAADRERHFTRDGNRIPGLNGWTRQVAELDTSQADIVRLAADGTMQGIDLHQRVPWDGDAYVVLPGERSGAMTLRLPDESVWELSVEELAEVVARDLEREGLAKDVPIVLPRSVPGGQIMVLAALLAHRTGHRVWMHAAQVGLSTRSGVLQLIQQDGRDKGDWKELPPGAPAWYADVDLRPTVSERTGRQNGVMSFTPEDLAGLRKPFSRWLDQVRTFVHFNPATNEWSDEQPLPGPGPEDEADHAYLHGVPGQAVVAMRDGSQRALGGEELDRWAGWLGRLLPNLQRPVSCYAGTPVDAAASAGNRGVGGRRAAVRRRPAAGHLRGAAMGQRDAEGEAHLRTQQRRDREGRQVRTRPVHRRAGAAHPLAEPAPGAAGR